MTHMAPRNEAEFSTELEIHGHSRLFGEKRNSVAGEAANRDGLK